MNNRLLIVEDDLIFSNLLKRSLKEISFFEIHVENTVNNAIIYINQNVIDYAILDLKLDNESGLLLISEIKNRYSHAKILILTGYSSISTAVEAIKLGAVEYLPKPTSIQNILKAFDLIEYQSVEMTELPLSLANLEWEHIQRVLNENQGNISATAKALNMHRRTLQRKLNSKKPPK